MLRRKQTIEPAAPLPEWQRRFDTAAELIRSQQQHPWLDDRLETLQQALGETHLAWQQLDVSLAQLDVDQTASDLKAALRERRRPRPGADSASTDRRVETLRRRYEAVNDMANRRDVLARQLIDTVADVELLAVQVVRSSTADAQQADHLSEHLERLDTDLRALELARREIDAL